MLWAWTIQLVFHCSQIKARQCAANGRYGSGPKAEPADTAFVGVAGLAGSGQVAMLGIATDVLATIAQTGHVFHGVTEMLTDTGALLLMQVPVNPVQLTPKGLHV